MQLQRFTPATFWPRMEENVGVERPVFILISYEGGLSLLLLNLPWYSIFQSNLQENRLPLHFVRTVSLVLSAGNWLQLDQHLHVWMYRMDRCSVWMDKCSCQWWALLTEEYEKEYGRSNQTCFNLGSAFNSLACCSFYKTYCHGALLHHFPPSCSDGVTIVGLHLPRVTPVGEPDVWKQGSGLWKQIIFI